MATRTRIVVLGIDGVPHSLLTRFIATGEFPHFARLAAETGLRQMDSVLPTVSSAAWTSYATGKQPGKHGIYGFVDRAPGSYDIEICLATSVVGNTVWDILSAAGKRVFAMNVPVTYPPRRVNGILIGGFLCPSVDKVADPPVVSRYLSSINYRIDTDSMLARQSKDRMLPDVNETLDRRMEAMFHFFEREEWDYFHTHIMATDRINHFLLVSFEAGEKKYADAFVAFYRRIDTYLGRLLDMLPDDCALVVLSDHGFCPITAEVQLSQYLVEKGWTQVGDGPAAHPLNIDPARSQAYTLIPGRVHLNLKGREPAGIVPLEEYDAVRERLAKDLLELRAPNGDRVIDRVRTREELYWGDGAHGPEPERCRESLLKDGTALGRGPDLVAIPVDGYDLKMGLAASETFVTTALEGMHTYDDALIMARGVALPEERFSIIQVTRAILEAAGVEPPADLD